MMDTPLFKKLSGTKALLYFLERFSFIRETFQKYECSLLGIDALEYFSLSKAHINIILLKLTYFPQHFPCNIPTKKTSKFVNNGLVRG